MSARELSVEDREAGAKAYHESARDTYMRVAGYGSVQPWGEMPESSRAVERQHFEAGYRAALAAREDAPRVACAVVVEDRVETVARASWEAKRTNAERAWDVLVDKPKQKWRGHVAAVLAVVDKEVKHARWKAVERQLEKTAMLEQKLAAEVERDRYKAALEASRGCEVEELPGDGQRPDEFRALADHLHDALTFMRSCELSGESGADHSTVVSALEAYDGFEWGGVEQLPDGSQPIKGESTRWMGKPGTDPSGQPDVTGVVRDTEREHEAARDERWTLVGQEDGNTPLVGGPHLPPGVEVVVAPVGRPLPSVETIKERDFALLHKHADVLAKALDKFLSDRLVGNSMSQIYELRVAVEPTLQALGYGKGETT